MMAGNAMIVHAVSGTLRCSQCAGRVVWAIRDTDGTTYCGPCLTQVYRGLDDPPAVVRRLWTHDPGTQVTDSTRACHWCGEPVAYSQAVRPLFDMNRFYHVGCRTAERQAACGRRELTGVSA